VRIIRYKPLEFVISSFSFAPITEEPLKLVQQSIFWDKPSLKGLISYFLWAIICSGKLGLKRRTSLLEGNE
jgi:hypothetical protein